MIKLNRDILYNSNNKIVIQVMNTSVENIQMIYRGKKFQFPVVVGSEGEEAIDISKLRTTTGLITLDPDYVNTGSCKSAISRSFIGV